MTVEKSIALPVGLYIVTYVPANSLAGCNGFTSGNSMPSPATPATYTLPFESRRGGLIVSAALRLGFVGFPPTVAHTSALPAGLSFARKFRFSHKVEGHGAVSYAPAVTGKS